MGTTRYEFKNSLDWISYLLTVTRMRRATNTVNYSSSLALAQNVSFLVNRPGFG